MLLPGATRLEEQALATWLFYRRRVAALVSGPGKDAFAGTFTAPGRDV
jgi:hypothetical protein